MTLNVKWQLTVASTLAFPRTGGRAAQRLINSLGLVYTFYLA